MRSYQRTPSSEAKPTILLITKSIFPYFLIGVYLFLSSSIFGQIDSLEKRLETLSDNQEKVDLLNQLSYQYHRKDVQKTFDYANEALVLAQSIDYTKGIAFAQHYLSIGNAISGDSELAKKLNKLVIQIADSLQINDLLISAFNMQAFNFTKDGKPVEAMKAFQKALDLAQKENDQIGYSSIALNLGEINAQNKDFEKARSYYKEALTVAEAIQEPARIAWANRLIGDTYVEEKKFAEAATFFKKAIQKAIIAKDPRSLSFAKARLGEVYMELGKIELAEKEMTAAIELIQQVGDKEGLIDGYIILMKILLKRNRPKKAINIGQQAVKITAQVKSIQQQLDIQELLAEAYAAEQDFRKAYQLKLSIETIRDSLDFTNKKKQATELEEKYQSKKKEAENALLRAEQQQQIAIIEQQKSFNFYLVTIASLLALLGYTAFQAYRNKQRNNLLLEEKVTERTEALQQTNEQLIQSNEELARFAYVASHDLREPLRNISNFTQLLKKATFPTNQTETTTYIDIIHKNTEHMNNLIIDTLEYTHLSKVNYTLTQINLNNTLEAVKAVLALKIKEQNATIQVLTPLPTIQSIKGLPFSLFKNLIENGIKYNENINPLIQIDCQPKKGSYLFSIKDNGIGIPPTYHQSIFEMFKRLQNRDKYQGSGMGLANCKKIVTKLGGKIWVESNGQNGSTFFFTIPQSGQRAYAQDLKKKKLLTISPSI